MQRETKQNRLPLPPGSFGWPLIGETVSFLRDSQFAEKRFRQYGNIFKTKIFGQPVLFVFGSENNYFFLTNENQYVQVNLPASTEALFGEGSVSVQTGELHKSRRQILYQAFQPRALADYFKTMEAITQNYLEQWYKKQEIVWYDELQCYTFDLACKFLIGLDHASNSRLKLLYERWLGGLFSFNTVKLPWTKFGKAWSSRQEIKKQLGQIIEARLAQEKKGNDALGILLQASDEEGKQLLAGEIEDQLLGLLFAGYGTLTSALASFCLLMAQNPEIFKKVREEQQKFPKNITPEQMKEMPYLDQVLQEVLRIIPPVGSGFRKVITDCEWGGYHIPKGWIIFLQITQTHKDIKVYKNPDKFKPERFDKNQVESKEKPFSYLPFGGGIRECLGKEFARLEMKMFASLLTRSYQWELLPNQNLELAFTPVPQPKDGLKVKIKSL